MLKCPHEIKLGQPQQCPECNMFNPSGKRLPEDCIHCNYLIREMEERVKNIKEITLEDLREKINFNNNIFDIGKKSS